MSKKIFGALISALFIFGISGFCFAQAIGAGNVNTSGADKKNVSGNPVNVKNKICPVSGTKLSEVMKSGMNPVAYEYKGKIYNLCCAGCITNFNKDPGKYVKKTEDELR